MLTHTRIASNPAAFSLHHRPGQPLSQGACNSASSHQRGERRAASVQSCAPVGPWPAVQESPATARLSPRRARRFHSHSHAPRPLSYTYTYTRAARHPYTLTRDPLLSHTRSAHAQAPGSNALVKRLLFSGQNLQGVSVPETPLVFHQPF